jgi:hypothetical protein
MNTIALATALALPDSELLARLPVLAANERTATADLVAHLAALRLRPSVYAAQGYGSLFAYCRRALRLSEDAAANRIHAAKACLKFPVILDLLASGDLSLSAIRMLRPHLTAENHERVLARARDARRVDIQRLVAELAPRPDVPTSVRKLHVPRVAELAATEGRSGMAGPVAQAALPAVVEGASSPVRIVRGDSMDEGIVAASGISPADVEGPGLRPAASASRAALQPLSPQRYRVQFTMGQESHDLLRRLQTLLRREIPDGDAGAIFERALRVLHEEVEAARFGKPPKRERTARAPRSTTLTGPPTRAYAIRIRPGADGGRSRYIPKAVRRAVWYRDRGQCGFVSASGVRCAEQGFLELHHIQPYALKGPATVGNIALRCPRHNAYEAEVVFGPRERPLRWEAGRQPESYERLGPSSIPGKK